jgi:SAM-dependent methyltransferase
MDRAMTQNIYDDEEFFAGYSRLGRSVEGLDGAAEWPALRAMLPDMHRLKVLDLGCGFGWFCRWARQQGAAQVLGVDVSQRMLARAAANTQDAAITCTRADLESFEPASASFDLAYSSLALHYIADLERLLSHVYQSLLPGGSFVFSVEHPMYTAPADPRWSADPTGRKSWPINGYLCEGPRSTDWLTQGVIKQHRTLATYVNLLLRIGFALRRIEEWGPTDEQIASRPELADERERPTFLLISAAR